MLVESGAAVLVVSPTNMSDVESDADAAAGLVAATEEEDSCPDDCSPLVPMDRRALSNCLKNGNVYVRYR